MSSRLFKSGRGFTLIELVVVITIIALLATALANRVLFYQEQAERTALMEVEAAIQSELVMKYGHLLAIGSEAQLSSLATENPMSWLAKAPRNYAGEFYDPLPAALPPGNWAFDLKARELVYLPDRTDNFSPAVEGEKWIRYRIRLLYEPVPGASVKTLAGALFEPVKPYRWLD